MIVFATAARLHGLWLPEIDDVIHLASAVPGLPSSAMTRTRRPEFRAHRLQLSDADTMVLDGIAVSTPARTWRDLAGRLSLAEHVALGDSVLRGGTTLDELCAVVARTTRLGNVRAARRSIPLLDVRARSRPESHLRVAASAADLPRFEVNVPVHRATGGWLAEPDLSLAAGKLALEYQGADHADRERMRRDLTRAADMRSEGWTILEYGPAEVFGRPWQVTAEVRETVRRLAPHLLQPRRRGRRVVTFA